MYATKRWTWETRKLNLKKASEKKADGDDSFEGVLGYMADYLGTVKAVSTVFMFYNVLTSYLPFFAIFSINKYSTSHQETCVCCSLNAYYTY